MDKRKLERFLEALGQRTRGPGTVFLVGGATAILEGWRPSTVDVDLKIDPEPSGIFEAIAALKDELSINVELASPDQFLPPLPGWRDRCDYVGRYGEVDVYHYDFYSQVLAKIERGHNQDLVDVQAMLSSKLIDPTRLRELFDQILADLIKYPAVDVDGLRGQIDEALRGQS